MQIMVNGRAYDVEPGTTILQFLEASGIDVRRIVVARNETILHRRMLNEKALDPGDELEIIKVVAGG